MLRHLILPEDCYDVISFKFRQGLSPLFREFSRMLVVYPQSSESTHNPIIRVLMRTVLSGQVGRTVAESPLQLDLQALI